MTPQLAPRTWQGRRVLAWVGLVLGVVVSAAVALATGLVLLTLAIVAGAIAVGVWLVLSVVAWAWFGFEQVTRRGYPFVLRPPVTRGPRLAVLNAAYLVTVPGLIGLAARVAGFLFVPLALGVSLLGLVVPRWRARPYIAVFTLPQLLAKLSGLRRRRGFFADGHKPVVVEYDAFLVASFSQIMDFLAWWRDPDAPDRYALAEHAMDDPVDFADLSLGPYPDPLGYPGLAAAAMRRGEIRGLRELFVSQREIDDMGDPDLDDRGDAAVIRIVSRLAADGVRLWVVQLPSTQTWHPRSGIAPNDITANLVIGAEREPTVTRAAIEAMTLAGIGADEPVLLAGFSLGGMVAAQVAQRAHELGFTVTHLVTAGAPLGRLAIPKSIHVLAIEHVLDPVPRIEGRENPVWSSPAPGAPQWVTVKAGPPVPRGYRVAVTHHSPSYAETAGQIEENPPDARVERFLRGSPVGRRGALEFFGPDQFLRDYAATRAGFSTPRAAVPFYLHSTVEDGITRGTLRSGLRRVPGVIAVDIYQSRTGFPTTIVWNADVLVQSLRPWFETVERAIVYRGLLSLLSLLKRRRAIGIHFRLQAKETPVSCGRPPCSVRRTASGASTST